MKLKEAPLKTHYMWEKHQKAITQCTRCPRLIEHCQKVALEKRKSYLGDVYWGKPVPSFGDTNARLILIGLAPAAHGANRTGRMFTGDRSGEWLYRALYKAGFANQASSENKNDGLLLTDAFVTASAHCAPPDNKPTPEELKNCAPFLDWELRHLKRAQVYLGLGKIGFDQAYTALCATGLTLPRKPVFSNGASYLLSNGTYLMGTYHPSQQNTFTGRLTEAMFDSVFQEVRLKISGNENSSVARPTV